MIPEVSNLCVIILDLGVFDVVESGISLVLGKMLPRVFLEEGNSAILDFLEGVTLNESSIAVGCIPYIRA
jgi:hypothetical protein